MPNSNIQITYRKIDELIPYANNPRDNAKAVDAVAKSIKRFGVRSPAIIDKNGVIIAGHTRILAAKKLGLAEFPVVVADDLTPEQANMYRLMDNRAQEESQWDTDFLSEELKELKVSGFDLTDTGFSPFEIESLTFDFAAAEASYARNNYTPNYGELTPAPDSSHQAGEYGSVYTQEEIDAESASDNDGDDLPYDTVNGEPMGSYTAQAQPPANQAAPKFEAFACIICCGTMEERQFVRDLIHETGELRQKYSMSEIMQRLMEN